jgi:hypothetical protein
MKHALFRVKHHLILTEIVEVLSKVIKQIPLLFRLHHYIINVGFDISPNLGFQDDVNTLLICRSSNFKTKCRLCVAENSERCDERCFIFVVDSKADLMIA